MTDFRGISKLIHIQLVKFDLAIMWLLFTAHVVIISNAHSPNPSAKLFFLISPPLNILWPSSFHIMSQGWCDGLTARTMSCYNWTGFWQVILKVPWGLNIFLAPLISTCPVMFNICLTVGYIIEPLKDTDVVRHVHWWWRKVTNKIGSYHEWPYSWFMWWQKSKKQSDCWITSGTCRKNTSVVFNIPPAGTRT